MNLKSILSSLACPVLLCIVLVGCGPNYSGEQRYPLSGRVTFNGEEVDMGNIAFLPTDPERQRPAGGRFEDGAYSFDEEFGANAGKYMVDIRWPKKTGVTFTNSFGFEEDVREEVVPAEFNIATTLTVDVGPGQTNFDFDLKSDKKPPKPRKNTGGNMPPYE